MIKFFPCLTQAMRYRLTIMVLVWTMSLFCADVFGQKSAIQRGVVTRQTVSAGSFYEYVPNAKFSRTTVVMICHGSVESAGPDATQSARTFIDRWQQVAEQHRCILAAPIFDEENFGSGPNTPGGEAWGYRALDGRKAGSDKFVNEIIDRYKTIDSKYDGKFYLYGHSAGGQFANHYLVVHPNRLHGVVLSAPAIYAMPDPETPWPNGMKARKRTLQWGDVAKEFEISHKTETWIAAVQLPVAVVIGSADTIRLSDQPQQGGWTRLERARHYTKEMDRFATEHKVKSGVRLKIVPNVKHDSLRLTPTCAQELAAMVKQNSKAER